MELETIYLIAAIALGICFVIFCPMAFTYLHKLKKNRKELAQTQDDLIVTKNDLMVANETKNKLMEDVKVLKFEKATVEEKLEAQTEETKKYTDLYMETADELSKTKDELEAEKKEKSKLMSRCMNLSTLKNSLEIEKDLLKKQIAELNGKLDNEQKRNEELTTENNVLVGVMRRVKDLTAVDTIKHATQTAAEGIANAAKKSATAVKNTTKLGAKKVVEAKNTVADKLQSVVSAVSLAAANALYWVSSRLVHLKESVAERRAKAAKEAEEE